MREIERLKSEVENTNDQVHPRHKLDTWSDDGWSTVRRRF